MLSRTPLPESIAVTASLSLVSTYQKPTRSLSSFADNAALQIVFSSVCFGAVLPLLLKRLRVDPAHSSTTIQVIMDILGVLLAVVVSSFLLDSPLGQFLISKLT